MALFQHVNKVYYNNSPQVTQTYLSDYLFGGLHVSPEGGLLRVCPCLEASTVDVYGHQGLRLLYDQGTTMTMAQWYLLLYNSFYLFLIFFFFIFFFFFFFVFFFFFCFGHYLSEEIPSL